MYVISVGKCQAHRLHDWDPGREDAWVIDSCPRYGDWMIGRDDWQLRGFKRAGPEWWANGRDETASGWEKEKERITVHTLLFVFTSFILLFSSSFILFVINWLFLSFSHMVLDSVEDEMFLILLSKYTVLKVPRPLIQPYITTNPLRPEQPLTSLRKGTEVENEILPIFIS